MGKFIAVKILPNDCSQDSNCFNAIIIEMIYSRVDYILQQIFPSALSKPILLGVSGGPDSLCLLDILHRSGFPLIIAHMNHSLRPEADADAQVVEQVAGELGVRFILGKEDVFSFAQQNKLSIEEAARHLRYRFLFAQARLNSVQAVAVAHSADDQVETILMHLLRGAGLQGLKGMPIICLPNAWSQDIPLIRPLLSSWRWEIIQYCQDRDLHPVQDQSNQDITYHRNRLRNELIPYLEKYNPQFRKMLWRTAQTLAGDDEIIKQALVLAWKECFLNEGHGYVAFRRSALVQQVRGMQRRLVRKGIDWVQPGLQDIEFEIVERAVEFIANPSRTGTLSLVGTLYLLLEGDRIWLFDWNARLPVYEWPQVPDHAGINLDIPGEVCLPHGWCLKAELVERASLPLSYNANQDAFQAWISFDGIHSPLLIRARHPGDRFQPLGMAVNTVKLSDLMINAKLPRRARFAWPLVCSRDAIIWVPGINISNRVRITADTRQVVYLRLSKTE
jgi:tRNA(Ile)-lysidine synthase